MGGRMWAESGGAGEGSLFRWCIRTMLPAPKAPASRCSSGCLSLDAPPVGACGSARSSVDGGGGTALAVLSPAPSAVLPSALPYQLAGRRILLVEACPMVRQVLSLALSRWGCAVCAVASEAEGVSRLKLLPAVASAGAGTDPSGMPASPPPAAQPPSGKPPAGERAGGGRRRSSQRRRCMQLEHAEALPEADSQARVESVCV